MSGSATFEAEGPGGPVRLRCFDNWLSRWVCRSILEGEFYPLIETLTDVRTIVDVGANCGAASVFFAAAYPEAEVHSLEPAAAPYGLLEANARANARITTHNIGLSDSDRVAPFYAGPIDSSTGSVDPTDAEPSETVELRDAAGWLTENGIENIDLLKLDVEGSELAVLGSMAAWLPRVRLLYVEFGGRGRMRELDALLAPTHEMAAGEIMLTHGEAIYVAKELAGPETERAVGELVRDRLRRRVDPG